MAPLPEPSPVVTVPELVRLLTDYHLLEPAALAEVVSTLQFRYPSSRDLARELLRRDWLTPYQANQLLRGRGGELLLGNYLVLERLGEGSMGRVLKARHRETGLVVALKLMQRERLDHPRALRRFRREIRAAVRLRHPNIVAAFGAGRSGNNPYLVLEYVEGVTLAALLQQRGRLAVRNACEYVRQAALGLQHAHEAGLIHRDVKPANLLLSTAGVVKLLDLGHARLVEADQGSAALTRLGAVIGTPDFVAPEQVRNSRRVGARADLYALGCTFYALLAGRVPFPDGDTVDKLISHLREEPVPLEQLRPDLPEGIGTMVRWLMAKQPADRFPTAGELAAALTETLRDLPAGGKGAALSLPPTVPPDSRPEGEGTSVAELTWPASRGRQGVRARMTALIAAAETALLALAELLRPPPRH